jgi:hypothetical protein
VKTLTDFSVFPPIRSLLFSVILSLVLSLYLKPNEGELIRTKKSCKSKLRKSVKVEQAIKSVKAKEDIMNARTGNTKLFHQLRENFNGLFGISSHKKFVVFCHSKSSIIFIFVGI